MVEIEYPQGAPAGNFRAALLLFIDETGQVRRVRARGAGLPADLEAAARSAFYATRFAPGEIDGQAVKSLYPVEVSFSADTSRAARGM
jgi:hypothetical protein